MNKYLNIKSKLGRYYKILKLYLPPLFRLSPDLKNRHRVIKKTRKNTKNFFEAKIYSLEKLASLIGTLPESNFRKDEFRELIEALPLLLNFIAATGERWSIGKIDNHPFDIVIARENLMDIKGKRALFYSAVFVQAKRLYKYGEQKMYIKEWITSLEKIIKEKIAKVDFGFNGQFHITNFAHLNGSPSEKDLVKYLKKMYIPYNKYIDCISLSMSLSSSRGDVTIITWIIYPFVRIIGIFDLDLNKVNLVYPRLHLSKMIITKDILT